MWRPWWNRYLKSILKFEGITDICQKFGKITGLRINFFGYRKVAGLHLLKTELCILLKIVDARHRRQTLQIRWADLVCMGLTWSPVHPSYSIILACYVDNQLKRNSFVRLIRPCRPDN
ncbi:hypothetical protein MPL3356_290028 [Mesorhizobium plurifarium]|uniref:Uncharacterized protein n=1 Tax=Mesorhizobium plurifarium TaxID=69974 RepID=A0A090DWU0_MESPL|nr:hypothetical protein MPL3356_290028 [Mesorhizobium plurifarium]CDX33696.1 hypothetical protein MPLDJ20_170024 [Mesorhizobium plurifarium]